MIIKSLLKVQTEVNMEMVSTLIYFDQWKKELNMTFSQVEMKKNLNK